MFQHAASYNSYLTELCQAAHADEADSIGNKLFPTVGVRTAVGTYKKRDINNAFRVYRTALARGNSPTRIDTNATPAYWNCEPNALEVGTWKFDADQDDGGMDERESNLQELMSSQLVTREFQAVSIFKAGVPVTSGAGIWSGEAGAAANIVNELDTLATTIQAGIGRRPNHLIFGQNAWMIAKNHSSLRELIHGQNVAVSLELLRSMLIFPDINISVASMPYNPEARGKKGKLKTIMGMDVFMFYSSDAPTRNDMSACKDFTMEPGGPEILSEEKTLETVDTMYWSTDRQVTCPAAAARLEIA